MKLGYGGKVSGLNQFLLLPQLSQIMTLASKVTPKKSSWFVSLNHVTLCTKICFAIYRWALLSWKVCNIWKKCTHYAKNKPKSENQIIYVFGYPNAWLGIFKLLHGLNPTPWVSLQGALKSLSSSLAKQSRCCDLTFFSHLHLWDRSCLGRFY